MAEPTCGEVRSFLASVAKGERATETAGVWNSLVTHRAVEGSPDAPRLTAIGQHLLQELQVRAQRIDGLPLETAASDLERVVRELDRAAKTAEYFLAELGPVTPPEIVSYLRPVAVELANRRETADQLAEEFRNFWGSVEVMGGGARDRLLAAELLSGASAELETMFAPFMQLAQRIRQTLGESAPSVAPAAVLQILADGHPVHFEDFVALCRAGLTAEEAALLVGLGPDPAQVVLSRRALVDALNREGPARSGAGHAATFLLALGGDPDRHVDRVRALAEALSPLLPDPVLAGAALSSIAHLEPSELMDWVHKATGLAKQRQLAPTPAELTALGVGLVLGLQPTDFDAAASPMGGSARRRCAVVLAPDAWLYRLLIEPTTLPPVLL